MEDSVREAIGAVIDPQFGRTLDELEAITELTVKGGIAEVTVALADPHYPYEERLGTAIDEAAGTIEGVGSSRVRYVTLDDDGADALMARLRPEKKLAGGPGSRTRVITVTSGKGGVGKSSVAANLAVTLAGRGRSVGLIDADVYGFSIPRMLGVLTPPAVVGGSLIAPQGYG
ncbi:MAG: P-loop NTPase, partial [Acidimicrobiia bacterium]